MLRWSHSQQMVFPIALSPVLKSPPQRPLALTLLSMADIFMLWKENEHFVFPDNEMMKKSVRWSMHNEWNKCGCISQILNYDQDILSPPTLLEDWCSQNRQRFLYCNSRRRSRLHLRRWLEFRVLGFHIKIISLLSCLPVRWLGSRRHFLLPSRFDRTRPHVWGKDSIQLVFIIVQICI